jgi:prepilin-type processing-associated H-X9-DG protein
MSLIELLCVIAIIALLAALLLPSLGQAQARARRIRCIDHLHEVGVGFVSYANDHGGRFPMAVPVSAGGSLEFARGGYSLPGEFYFSYRHFQAASNELVTPRLMICPADTRPPATSFAALSNANLSYFIGVNAEVARSTSILAGDRNLTNDYANPGTLLRLGPSYALRWTGELHRFKGNLLFADGHVEEKNNHALASSASQVPEVTSLVLPTVRQPGVAAASSGMPGAHTAVGAPDVRESGSLLPATNVRSLTGPISGIQAVRRATTPQWAPDVPAGGVLVETSSPPTGETRSTNAIAAGTPPKPQEESPILSRLGLWVATTMGDLAEKSLWWLYTLLLLLAAVVLLLRLWIRRRNKETPKPSTGFDSSTAP